MAEFIDLSDPEIRRVADAIKAAGPWMTMKSHVSSAAYALAVSELRQESARYRAALELIAGEDYRSNERARRLAGQALT